MDDRYIKLALDLRLTKEANLKAKILAMIARLKKGAKPALTTAKKTTVEAAKKGKEVASKAKAKVDPKMKELWEAIKRNKKPLAVGWAGGVAGGVAAS